MASLTAQRHLNITNGQLSKVLERMSTGLRINRSADDAAGLAISSKLRTQVLGLHQAMDNTQDAIHLLQTAEGGLSQSMLILQRLRELAIQSANDTYVQNDRQKIQVEVSQLLAELDRISRTTEFNTRKLLDGSVQGGSFRQQDPSVLVTKNFRVGDNSIAIPILKDFIEAIVSIAPDMTLDTAIQFKLVASSETTMGLEIYSSQLGFHTLFNNINSVPTILGIPLNSLSGSSPMLTVQLNTVRPIDPADFATPLQTLVTQGILAPITFGNMVVTGGATVYPPIAITGAMSINDIVTAINGLDPSFTASISNGQITVQYTDIGFGTATAVQNYTATPPVSFGGPGAAPPTPPYPAIVPPAPGFAIAAPPVNFPPIPGALNSAISFAGTDASFQTVFAMANAASSGILSNYFGPAGAGAAGVQYIGEAFAAPSPSEFVFRTTAVFGQAGANNDMESTQTANGVNTGITAADINTPFIAFTTPKVTNPGFPVPGVPQAFTINFNNNGNFDFQFYNVGTGVYTGALENAGFDSSVHSINDVANAINAYATFRGYAPVPPILGGGAEQVGASFDPVTDQFTLINNQNGGGAAGGDITFGGAAGILLAPFFEVPVNTPSQPAVTIAVSASDIDNSAIDPSLDLTAADLNQPIENLMEPRFPTTVQGNLFINGDLVMNIDPNTDTIQTVINTVNAFTGSGNQTYVANFDATVPGGLSITVVDHEDFAAAGAPPAVSAGTTQYNGNQVIADGAAVFAPASAPQTYNNGAVDLTPLGAAGPTEFTNQVALPGGPYSDPGVTPPPAILANISFGGTSNIATVLGMTPSGPGVGAPTGNTFFDATITPTSHDTYDVTTTRRDEYSGTATAISATIGIPLPSLDDVNQVAVVQVIGKRTEVVEDRALSFQIGANEGQYIRVGIDEVSTRKLKLETLSLLGDSDEESRVIAQNAMGVIDDAISSISGSMSKLGAVQNRLELNISNLSVAHENMSQANSRIMDIDYASAVTELTRLQIITQAGVAALAQANLVINNALRLLR